MTNIQPNLTIGRTDDPLERDADRVADHVMRTPDPAPSIGEAPQQAARKCVACADADEDTQKLQMKPVGASQSQTGEAPGVVYSVLQSPGQPIEPTTRAVFEGRFGHDFSGIRVHTDADAAVSARSIGARAYTVGNHIAFGVGQYEPGTVVGDRLISHELVHVLQQAAPLGAQFGVSGPVLQRDAENHPPPTPSGTMFHPGVAHDHKPSGRWHDVQARLDTSDVSSRIACEMFDLDGVAYLAIVYLSGSPLAQSYLLWYLLDGNGADMTVNVNSMLRGDDNLLKVIGRRLPAQTSGKFSSYFKVEQYMYSNQDTRFAIGAIDRFDLGAALLK